MTIISCILFFDFCLLGLVFVFLVVSPVVFFLVFVCCWLFGVFFVDSIQLCFADSIFLFACRIAFCNAFVSLSWLSSVFVCCKYKTCSINAFNCINKNIKIWKQLCINIFQLLGIFTYVFVHIFAIIQEFFTCFKTCKLTDWRYQKLSNHIWNGRWGPLQGENIWPCQ